MPHPGRVERHLKALSALRPLNAVIMAVGTVVGALLAAGAETLSTPNLPQLFLAAGATVCIGAAGNVVNDIFDVEVDRINRSDRPIPSGALSVRSAGLMWAGVSIAGVILAALLTAIHLIIAVATVGLLFLYSAFLKSRVLVGNVAVAIAVALALVFGGLAVITPDYSRISLVLAGASFAFLTTLAREIVKDVEDVEGDAEEGARTLPLAAGVQPAAALASTITLLTVGALPLVVSAGLPTFFLPLALPAATLLLGAAWCALGMVTNHHEAQQQSAASSSLLLKGAMLMGMAALGVSAW